MSWKKVNGIDKANLQTAFSMYLNTLLGQTESKDSKSSLYYKVKFDDEETLLVETKDDKSLKLGPLPYRPQDTSTQVEIYVQFGLTVKKKQVNNDPKYYIIKSSTEMVYLNIIENENGKEDRKRVQGLHFDFDLNSKQKNGENGEQDANHPIFHAQYNPNCVDTNAIERWNPKLHERSYPEFPRIPCAPFDIVSVGYMILNDHFPDQVVNNRGWPSDGMIHKDYLPRFPEEAFKHERTDNKMVPEWWYLHHSIDDGVPRLDPGTHRPV